MSIVVDKLPNFLLPRFSSEIDLFMGYIYSNARNPRYRETFIKAIVHTSKVYFFSYKFLSPKQTYQLLTDKIRKSRIKEMVNKIIENAVKDGEEEWANKFKSLFE